MKRRFRLTRSNDFQRVRRFGKSYAHPLIVLIASPAEAPEQTRFGVSAGRALGNAVRRNRAKRLLRAALQPHLEQIEPGWDVILIARKPLPLATFQEVRSALLGLLRKAQLLKDLDG